MKKIFCCLLLFSSITIFDCAGLFFNEQFNCATATAPNNGTYSRTSHSVTIYTESGHCKGSYAVYLHYGQKYISFNNTWICIQGKRRFAYGGNWYIIS